MKTNDRGREIIVDCEGFRTSAYPCPGSALAVELGKPPSKRRKDWMCLPGDPWTIGIGATGPGIGPGVVWTPDQIWKRFEEDIAERERLVHHYVTAPLNENQFSALVSFFFNVKLKSILSGGPDGGHCTLLRKLNAGDYSGAAQEFPKWKYSGGVVMRGLVERRRREQELFLAPIAAVRAVS